MALIISVALTALLVSPVFALAGWLKPVATMPIAGRKTFKIRR